MKLFVLTFCRRPELVYGSTLTFRTLRVGFPDAAVSVVDNGSVPAAREAIEVAARSVDASFHALPRPNTVTHAQFLARTLLEAGPEPIAFLDPDLVFWSRCDGFALDGLLGGRLIPEFRDEFSGCLTLPRLHTSFLVVPDPPALAARIRELSARYFGFAGFEPFMFPEAGSWKRLDTGAALYGALGAQAVPFGERELDAYDHLFCGSHLDLVARHLPEDERVLVETWHRWAQHDPALLRGIWRRQEEFFARRSP